MRVEEVIGDFVQLKRAGSNYKGLSPFSNERTPSFMVSPVKQIWKDFSSGKGGNAIAFLMEHEHFTYPEAIRYLAKKYHIEIEESQPSTEEKEKADERESLYIVSEYAQQFFQDSLLNTEAGKAIGLSYFKERGFTDDTIKKFCLGFSPDEWTAFTDAALAKGYQLPYLEKTGLTIVNADRKFDRFKGRVMFPIHSMSGRVLGFGGRILTNDKKQAKYLNSPESDIYHKSKVLYGIFFAKQAIAKADNCYLVEGYTDVIQLHQKGIENVVASSGTALTPDQIRLIHRLTPNITVLYDGDAAGLRASIRGVDLILEQGMNVKVCTFPEGEDPDSFAKSNSLEEIQEYFKTNTQDFIRFKASLLMSETKDDPLKRADTIRDMIESISKITDPIKSEIYVRECAQIMEISEDVLFASLSQINQRELIKAQQELKKAKKETALAPVQPVERVSPIMVLERELIKYLLLYGTKECVFYENFLYYDKETGEEKNQELSQRMKVYEKLFLELQADEIELTTPEFKEFYDFFIRKYQEGLEDFSKIVHELSPQMASLVATFQAEEEKIRLHNWGRKDVVVKSIEEDLAVAINSLILNFRKMLINKKIEELREKVTSIESQGGDPMEELQEVVTYNSLKIIIGKKLGWNL